MFRRRFLLAVPLVLLLAGCGAQKPAVPTPASLDFNRIFPASGGIPGWNISQELRTYDRSNLYDLVDGQAESFFVYGFEGVAVQRYQDASGTLLHVETWQLATQADAYGLFSAGRAGQPAAVGVEGDADPGRRMAFWQDRYFTSLNASQPVPDETLQAFAGAISGKLPSGGKRPTLVEGLPQENLVPLSSIFFHEEMSVQLEIWLGGENLLGLSPQTDGVVARYQLDGQIVRLLQVEYPAAGGAARGLHALQAGNLTNLLASGANGNRLGAVFGKIEPQKAEALLEKALK